MIHRSRLLFTRSSLPQARVSCYGQEGQRPQLAYIAFCEALAKHIFQTCLAALTGVPYTRRRWQLAQLCKLILPILIHPRPHLLAQLSAIRLDQIPQVVVCLQSPTMYCSISTKVRHITAFIASIELSLPSTSHHRHLPAPYHGPLVCIIRPISSINRIASVRGISDEQSHRIRQTSRERRKDVICCRRDESAELCLVRGVE